MSRPLTLLAALSLLACSEAVEEAPSDVAPALAFAARLPTSANLAMEVPGTTSARSLGDSDPFHALTLEASGSVNGMVADWLDLMHDVVSTTPQAQDDNSWIWGPYHGGDGGLGVTTEFFLVEQNADGSFSYALIEAPRDQEDDRDAWQAIVAGQLLGGTGVEDSWGWFVVDWTAASELDDRRDTAGQAVFAYDFTGTHTADIGGGPMVIAGLSGVAEAEDEPFDAVYGYYRLPSGAGVMDLYVHSDLDDEGTEPEFWAVRSRWQADGAGRIDGLVTGGDLGNQEADFSDCWDDGFQTVWERFDWSAEAGDEASCAFSDADLPGAFPDWMEDVLL